MAAHSVEHEPVWRGLLLALLLSLPVWLVLMVWLVW